MCARKRCAQEAVRVRRTQPARARGLVALLWSQCKACNLTSRNLSFHATAFTYLSGKATYESASALPSSHTSVVVPDRGAPMTCTTNPAETIGTDHTGDSPLAAGGSCAQRRERGRTNTVEEWNPGLTDLLSRMIRTTNVCCPNRQKRQAWTTVYGTTGLDRVHFLRYFSRRLLS